MKMSFDHTLVRAFGTFMDSLKKIVAENTSHIQTPQGKDVWEVSYEEGYKYVRIVLTSESPNGTKQKTAWGVIDKRSGDIFRSASWKAPSLNHIRGNIFDENNGLKNVHWTGPAYIWEINGKEKEEASVTITTAPATEVV